MTPVLREQGSGRGDWLLARTFCSLIVIGCLFGIILPAGIGWDFANFYDTGRRVLAGELGNLFHPHTLIAGQPPQGGLLFFGAPLSAFLYAPMALLSPIWALAVFKIETTVAYFLGLYLLYREYKPFAGADERSVARFAALFAGCALIFQPFWTVYRVGGQTTALVFLLLVCTLISHTRQRFLLSALCFTVAVMIKPAFAPALAFLALISGWRFFLTVAGVLTGLGGVSLLLLGWNVHREFLHVMIQGSANANVAWPFSSSVYVAFSSLKRIVSPATAHALSNVSLGVKLGMVALMAWLVRRSYAQQLPSRARLHFSFLAALSFCLLTAEVLWEHYLSMLFFLLIYVVAARQYFSRAALALVIAAFVMSVGQNLIVINFVVRHFRFESMAGVVFISILKSSPVLLMLVLLVRHQAEFFRSYRALAWSASNAPTKATPAGAEAPDASWAVPSKANA